ncbi:MAG TPA: dihydroneopterin aldolase [Chloroflexia bacterium]|nr:dihydroneopterin aldolase [Chloroflexia bacterium]
MELSTTRAARDRILLRGLVFYGYHGVSREEQTLGQRFRVDLALSVDLAAAAHSDALADTVSYAAVYQQVQAIMEGPPSRLLEHVAGQIGRAILADRRVRRVRVRIWKPGVPIPGLVRGMTGVALVFDQEATA